MPCRQRGLEFHRPLVRLPWRDRVGRAIPYLFAATLALVLLLALPMRASAQDASGQVWGDLRLLFPQKDGVWLLYADVGPKLQVSGDERWAKIVFDPAAEYRALDLVDLLGDLSVSYTVQNDDVETLELVPRIGARLHLISDIRDVRPAGRFAKRVGLGTEVRLEHRHFWYYGSGATEPYSADWRLRIRLATRIGINHADRSRPGTWYLFADAEAFVPLDDVNPETFTTEWRFRVGPGVVVDRTWHLELLYIRDISRNTMEEEFENSVNAIDLRAKLYH